jgi:hypothetical protein
MKIKKLLKVYNYNESGKVVITDLTRSSYNSEHILFSGYCREIYCYYPDLLNLKIANFYFEGQFLKIVAYNEKEK